MSYLQASLPVIVTGLKLHGPFPSLEPLEVVAFKDFRRAANILPGKGRFSGRLTRDDLMGQCVACCSSNAGYRAAVFHPARPGETPKYIGLRDISTPTQLTDFVSAIRLRPPKRRIVMRVSIAAYRPTRAENSSILHCAPTPPVHYRVRQAAQLTSHGRVAWWSPHPNEGNGSNKQDKV